MEQVQLRARGVRPGGLESAELLISRAGMFQAGHADMRLPVNTGGQVLGWIRLPSVSRKNGSARGANPLGRVVGDGVGVGPREMGGRKEGRERNVGSRSMWREGVEGRKIEDDRECWPRVRSKGQVKCKWSRRMAGVNQRASRVVDPRSPIRFSGGGRDVT